MLAHCIACLLLTPSNAEHMKLVLLPLVSTFSSACTAWATLCQRMKVVVVESLFTLYASHAEY